MSAAAQRPSSEVFAALLNWIDGIGESGLDGHDLRELGLKDGNLTVDDERTGKQWSFRDITLSVERPSYRADSALDGWQRIESFFGRQLS